MTETEYLTQMHILGEELARADSAEPYDLEAHADVINKINELNHQWYVSLGARRRIKNIVCVAVTLFVLYLIYLLLSEAFRS